MKKLSFDELIDRISFPEYLLNNGYDPNIKKSTVVHKVFGKGKDDEVIVTKHKLTNKWVFKSISDPDNDRGNIINFVINRLNGNVSTVVKYNNDYQKVSDILNNYIGIPINERENKIQKFKNYIKVENKKEEFNYHLYGAKKIEDFKYLTGRDINKETIESNLFKGRVIEAKPIYFDKVKNKWLQQENYCTAFPLFSANNDVIGLQIHKEDGEKRFGKNTNREIGIWKSNILKSTNTIAVSEEALDCISHSELHNRNLKIAYLATFGTPSLKHNNIIEKELIDNGISNILIINDNDSPGQEFNLNLILHFVNKEHNIQIVNKDKSKIVVAIDKATLNNTKIVEMLRLLKLYNQKKENEITLFSKVDEIKNNLYVYDSFKTIKTTTSKFNIVIPRNKDALYIFNRYILNLVNSKVENIKIKIEKSIKKDWNDDLKIQKTKQNNFNTQQKIIINQKMKL